MPFTIVQAGSSIQAVSTAGTITTLTLPTGVTVDSSIRGQFHILGRQLLFTRAATINLWIDPLTFTVRPMVIQTPTAPPTLSASGTGLDNGYRAAYAFGIENSEGKIIAESALSPVSDQIQLTNQGITYTNIQVSPDTSVNCRIVYRTLEDGGADSLFRLAVIHDNVTTSLLQDATPDDELGTLPADTDLDPPPGTVPGTSFSLACVYKSRLWGFDSEDPDSLVYSKAQQFSKFTQSGGLRLTGDGEDQYGGQGFLPRREELVIVKRNRVIRLVGETEDDFELIPDDSSQNTGCIAPFSCVVIGNVGYFLASDGVYVVDSEGVRSITYGLVDPWFKSDLYFDRTGFYAAVGGYNADTHAYELHLPSVSAGTTLNRWIAYDIDKGVWYGPHVTTSFTPTSRAIVLTSAGIKQSAMGGSDGYIYLMNQTTRADITGGSGTHVGISIDWITSFMWADSPDFFHYWGMPTFHYKNENLEAGGGSWDNVSLTWFVGEIVPNSFPLSDSLPLNVDRKRTMRLGAGRLMRMRFTHSTADIDFLLRGFTVYHNTVGRR